MSTNKPAQFNPVRGYHPEGAYWQGPSETQEVEPLDLPKGRHWTDDELRARLPAMTLAQQVEILIGKFIGGGIEKHYDGETDSLTAGRRIARYMMGRFKKFGVSFASRLTGEASVAPQDETRLTRGDIVNIVKRIRAVPHLDDAVSLAVRGLVRAAPSPVPAPAQEDPIRALIAKWRAYARRADSFHATMGTGWHVCAEELEALLIPTGEAASPAQPSDDFWDRENQWWTDRANEEQANGNAYAAHGYRCAAHAIRMARDRFEAASPAQTPTSTSSAAAQPPS